VDGTILKSIQFECKMMGYDKNKTNENEEKTWKKR
jgi:hypothetical protein